MSDACMFCEIVAGERQAEVVHESADALAFRDVNAQSPTHVLVIPRRHEPDLASLVRADPDAAVGLLRAVADVADSEGLEHHRVVFNTGTNAGQSVFHVHAHVLGGRSLGWPPG